MYDKLPKGINALYVESLYVEYRDCDYAVGSVIADNEELDNITLSFSELEEKSKKVAEFLNIDISEVKLIIGTRPC